MCAPFTLPICNGSGLLIGSTIIYSTFCSGDLAQWSYLFSFRTQKSSTVAAMVLFMGE